MTGVFLSCCWSVPKADAQVQIIEPVSTGDRQVTLDWNPAPGDTLSPEERATTAILTFEIRKSLGISTRGLTSGAPVRGRGAGGIGLDGFVVRVGNGADFFRVGQEPPPPQVSGFSVTGAFQFGARYVGVGFSDTVNAAQAQNPANYVFTPSLPVQSISVQANEQTVIIQTQNPIPPSTSYSVNVSGVSGEEGQTLSNPGSFNFQSVAGSVTDISQIQGDVAAYRGQTVTLVGQVYIPVGTGVSAPSGYIQDGSGNGINLFGGAFVQQPVDSRANVVEVTGTVSDTLQKVSIRNYSAATVAGGQPWLGARRVPLKDAQDSRWEGTYIDVSGLLVRIDALSDPDLIRVEVTQRDTLFAGYRVWRRQSESENDFKLLRTYSLLDSTWSFVGGERTFADPDSVIPRGRERDFDFEIGDQVPGPFNGFGYYYAVTRYDAVIDATAFPIRITEFENETPGSVATTDPVYPGRLARGAIPLLSEVRVVPNPFNPAADFGKQAFPGPPRVQFVNLPSTAHIEIYTVAGDLVRELDKVDNSNVDSVDWDLKNNDGRNVSPGIYLYLVQVSGESATGRFVLAR